MERPVHLLPDRWEQRPASIAEELFPKRCSAIRDTGPELVSVLRTILPPAPDISRLRGNVGPRVPSERNTRAAGDALDLARG